MGVWKLTGPPEGDEDFDNDGCHLPDDDEDGSWLEGEDEDDSNIIDWDDDE